LVQILREVKRVLKKGATLWLNLGDCHYSRSKYGPHAYLKNKDLIGVPWQVAFALQADGWYLRLDNIWFKPNCLPESVRDRPTKSHEYMFLLSKSSEYFYDADAVREPCAESSLQLQKTNGKQNGRSKDHSHGINHNRSVRKALGNFARNPADRSLRSVWRIPTQPFRDAHSAVFPEKLVEVCMLAGCPQWVCTKCGKPRTKIIETTVLEKGKSYADKTADAVQASQTSALRLKQKIVRRRVVGYTKCHCAARYERGTVLDAFCGAGTTAVVAKRLDRNFLGIEINPAYIRLANRRLRQGRAPRSQQYDRSMHRRR
jgi:DNA modification methylase